MHGHSLRRRQLVIGALAGAAALPFGLGGCSDGGKAGVLQVGGLPVTCNLTLPVACVSRAKANAAAGAQGSPFAYEYAKFNG